MVACCYKRLGLRRLWFVLAASWFLFLPAASAKGINLLADAPAKLATENLDAVQLAQIRALTDGNTSKPIQAITGTLEFVVDLGEVHHADRIDVSLLRAERGKRGKRDKGGKGAKQSKAALQVELLGSIVAPDTGYQLMRKETLTPGRARQRLAFRPVAVRWLMVRLVPGNNPRGIGLTELAVPGQVGPPETRYGFQESPVTAAAVLERLRTDLNLQLTERELSLVRDAADSRLDDWTPAEAALLASGALSAKAQQPFLEQLDRVTEQARRAVAKAKGTAGKARQLLKHLHRTVMKAGYQEKQTDLSRLLDTGRFNCVSSAVLFGIVGQRLGMDVRGIEVPDHAFAIVYDGSRSADVETTTPNGYNPARSRAVLEAFTRQTGFSYIPGSNASRRRETSLPGLVALIYYNHGVRHTRAEQYEAAVNAYYRALSLDPGLVSAVKNTLAVLGKWAAVRADRGEFESARALLTTALSLAPDDYRLRHNRRVIWNQQIAAVAASQDFDQLVVLTDQAHREDPKGGFDRAQGRLFIDRARQLVGTGQWQPALQVLSDGHQRVNAASRKSIDRYRAGVVMRWMSSDLKAGRWEQAFGAVKSGQNLLPSDRRLQQNAAYLLQEWSRHAVAKDGVDAGYHVAQQVLAVYPDSTAVKRAARSFVLRQVKALRDSGDDAGATRAVQKMADLLRGERDASTLVESVYVQRAAERIQARDWATAAAIYEQAANELPGGGKSARYYQKNVAYIAQEWLRDTASAANAGNAADMRELTADLLTRFDDVRGLQRVIASHYQRLADQLIRKGEFETAAGHADWVADAMEGSTQGMKVVRYTYDRWARHWTAKRNWQQAVDVYAQALDAYPNDAHLKRNAVATWHAWAKTHMDKKEWDEAIAIYQQGQKQLPSVSLFRRNIRYCEQQRGSG